MTVGTERILGIFFSGAGIFLLDFPRKIALPGITRTVMLQARPIPDPRVTPPRERGVCSLSNRLRVRTMCIPRQPRAILRDTACHSPLPDDNRKPGTLQDAPGPRKNQSTGPRSGFFPKRGDGRGFGILPPAPIPWFLFRYFPFATPLTDPFWHMTGLIVDKFPGSQ